MFSAPSTFPTKTDATRFLEVVEADIARGLYIDPGAGRVTFAAWSDRWLARPGKREASTARDRQALASFRPHLGSVLLIGLTPGLIQEAADLRSKVATPAAVARDFSALRAVLTAAVNADLTARSPVRNIALPRVVHPERSGLSPFELAALVKEEPGHCRALVLVGAVLGLRWGEAVGLRVRDVDFMRQTVTITQTVEELSGHMRIVPEAKTRSSLRTLAVPGFLMDELTRHLQQHRQAVIGQHVVPDALTFVGPRGGTLRRRFGERILWPAGKRAGLSTSLSFHSLGHCAVTAMADTGVPYNVTQARAGHSTARMTMEPYSHRTTAADRVAAEALQAHFGETFAAGSGTSVARSAASQRKGTEKEQVRSSISVGDNSLHTAEVAGSSPAAPTRNSRSCLFSVCPLRRNRCRSRQSLVTTAPTSSWDLGSPLGRGATVDRRAGVG